MPFEPVHPQALRLHRSVTARAVAGLALVMGAPLLAACDGTDHGVEPSVTTPTSTRTSLTPTTPTPTTATPTTTTQPSVPTTSTPAPLDLGSAAAGVVEPAAATPEDLLVALELNGSEQSRVVSGQDVAVVLAGIDAYRNKVFRSSSGFAATSTFWTEWNENSPFPLSDETPTLDDPRVAEITVLDTGAIWAEYPNGDWFAYDPSTGIEHQLSESPFDGTLFARERLRSPGPSIIFEVSRHDPFALLAHKTDAVQIEISTTSFEGGPAIQIRPVEGSFYVFLEEEGMTHTTSWIWPQVWSSRPRAPPTASTHSSPTSLRRVRCPSAYLHRFPKA